MKLAENEIALWLQPIEERTIVQPEKILSEAELARYHGLQRPAKRAELLCSRLLLYKIRHCYLPEETDSIETVVGKLGRPFWYVRGEKVPLYFSLSHTKKIVACAVARIAEIGCDIEQISPRKYERELAVKVFGPKERAHYQAQHCETTARRFFYQNWTLKEAYCKALGTGLRMPLTGLDFTHKIFTPHFTLVCPRENEAEDQWYFFHQFLLQDFSLSIAAKRASGKSRSARPALFCQFPFDRISVQP